MHRRFIALAALLATAARSATAGEVIDRVAPHVNAGGACRRKNRGAIVAAVCALWVLPVTAALMMVTSSSVRAAEITYVETLKGGTGGVLGMNGASDVATSPDGRHVYVAAYANSAIAIFSRNLSTGRLTYVGYVTSSGGGPTIT